MRILVCEDEPVFGENLIKEIQAYFQNKGEKTEVIYCKNGAEFENATRLERQAEEKKDNVSSTESFDLLFMDIHLGDRDGIRLIEDLREKEEKTISKTPVIFVSSMENRVLDGYDVNAFSFLYKRNYRDKLESTLDRFLKEYGSTAKISVQNGDKVSLFSFRDIFYVEADGRKTKVHTGQDSAIDERGIGTFMKDLPESSFLEVYKCVYVNVEHIRRVDSDTLLLENAETLPISRRKRKAVLEAVMRNLGGK